MVVTLVLIEDFSILSDIFVEKSEFDIGILYIYSRETCLFYTLCAFTLVHHPYIITLMNPKPNEKRDIILDSIADGVFTVDKNWHITTFNKAAQKITGIPREKAIGQICRDVLRANVCETDCALRHTMDTGSPVINRPVHIVDLEGRRKSITISTALLKDKKGRVIGGVETFRDMTVVEELRKQIQKQYTCEDIISRNNRIQELFNTLPQIAESNCTVLIEGQTGTGKELFARAIHNLSHRREKPFVAVNCSALPDTLLESELFGYKAGAFTDAKKDKPGRFALAEGGTIFLDEIGDMSSTVQVKLLRVLQEKTYEPVGAVSSEKADVRVVTASNKDLAELIEQGKYRSDLYYRINVVKLSLPPLKERSEDIPLLINHFINRFNRIYDKNICCFSDDAMAVLMSYEFPGNIRELENILEHCFVLCQGDVIETMHLPSAIQRSIKGQESEIGEFRTLRQMELLMIERALSRNDGNRTAAAKELGINPSTLFRKLKSLNIKTE
jgi:PAS domain S-box-containing protein